MVRVLRPSFSEINCLVHLYVLMDHALRESSLDDAPPVGLVGVTRSDAPGLLRETLLVLVAPFCSGFDSGMLDGGTATTRWNV